MQILGCEQNVMDIVEGVKAGMEIPLKYVDRKWIVHDNNVIYPAGHENSGVVLIECFY